MEPKIIDVIAVVGRRGALAQSEIKRPVVLIVEDEFLIRMDAVEMVQAAGFDVVEASNADEASSSSKIG